MKAWGGVIGKGATGGGAGRGGLLRVVPDPGRAEALLQRRGDAVRQGRSCRLLLPVDLLIGPLAW